MNLVLTTTTINSPTEATIKFAERGLPFIIAGDLKTPHDEYRRLQDMHPNVIYLDPLEQEKLYPELSTVIGWKTIQRRNIAFCYAYQLGAEIIATLDDDNVPLENWGKKIMVDQELETYTIECANDCFDPVSFVGGDYVDLYHRGFPLELVRRKHLQFKGAKKEKVRVDIQADLWIGAADVDAVCRSIIGDQAFHFNKSVFPFRSNAIAPFNSQNTFISRRVFPHYCVFPFVGRHDDIFASYFAQSKGASVIYGEPTVIQNRNPHDVIKDMELELFGYRTITLKFLQDIQENPDNIWNYLPDNTKRFFDIYCKQFK